MLTESLVLALFGGALGFVIASRGARAIVAANAWTIPRTIDIRPDARVAAFALGASLLTAVLFGLMPALAASRVDVHDHLNAGGRSGTEGGPPRRTRGALIVVETALAVVLLTGAALLMRTFWNLTHVDTGFRSANVLSLTIDMSADVMGGDRRNAYRREVMDRISALPGVLAVGGGTVIPLHGVGEYYPIAVPGEAEPVIPETQIVTGDYFRALGVPLVGGRLFTESGGPAGPS
jgi:predicted lysophospholipase L1 biosynthesis ABC-type transport system permease subunit